MEWAGKCVCAFSLCFIYVTSYFGVFLFCLKHTFKSECDNQTDVIIEVKSLEISSIVDIIVAVCSSCCFLPFCPLSGLKNVPFDTKTDVCCFFLSVKMCLREIFYSFQTSSYKSDILSPAQILNLQ